MSGLATSRLYPPGSCAKAVERLIMLHVADEAWRGEMVAFLDAALMEARDIGAAEALAAAERKMENDG